MPQAWKTSLKAALIIGILRVKLIEGTLIDTIFIEDIVESVTVSKLMDGHVGGKAWFGDLLTGTNMSGENAVARGAVCAGIVSSFFVRHVVQNGMEGRAPVKGIFQTNLLSTVLAREAERGTARD